MALRTPGGCWCCRVVLRRAAMIAAVGSLTLGACSDDNPSSRAEESTDPSAGEVAAEGTTTSTTQPSTAEDEEAAFGIVKALVGEATAVSDRLFENPAMVLDSASRDVARLREIYTEDSRHLEALIGELEELANEGRRLQAGSSGVLSTELVWSLAADDEDTISFRACSVFDEETLDSDGDVVDSGATSILGSGEAHWVDGSWRLTGISADSDGITEIQPDDVTSVRKFCEALSESEDGA